MNVKSIFAKVLPTIAATIIPGSPLALMGASMLAKVLGKDKIDPTPQAMDAAITEAQAKDPTILLELKKADAELQIRLTEMGFDSIEKLESLAVDDRKDARAREIAIKDNTPKILAYAVTLGFFAMIAGLFYFPIPANSQPVIFSLVGVLGTAWIAIITYYFGSSSQSAGKTQMIADQAATAQANLLEFKKAA